MARYLDRRFSLGLFPKDKEGIQRVLSGFIENDLEDVAFKINDSLIIPTRPLVERGMLIRHKERKFGKGCVAQWARDRKQWEARLAERLAPADNILASSPFLAEERALFVDYMLFGVLGNYLFSGKTRLPNLPHLARWRRVMRRPSPAGGRGG